jgi:hypothetical protein
VTPGLQVASKHHLVDFGVVLVDSRGGLEMRSVKLSNRSGRTLYLSWDRSALRDVSLKHTPLVMPINAPDFMEVRLAVEARVQPVEELFHLQIQGGPRVSISVRAVMQVVCVRFQSVPRMVPSQLARSNTMMSTTTGGNDADSVGRAAAAGGRGARNDLSIIDLGVVVANAWDMPFADLWMHNPMGASLRIVTDCPNLSGSVLQLDPAQSIVMQPGHYARIRIQTKAQSLDRNEQSRSLLPRVRVGVGSAAAGSVKHLAIQLHVVQAAFDVSIGKAPDATAAAADDDGWLSRCVEASLPPLLLDTPAPRECSFWVRNRTPGQVGVNFHVRVAQPAPSSVRLRVRSDNHFIKAGGAAQVTCTAVVQRAPPLGTPIAETVVLELEVEGVRRVRQIRMVVQVNYSRPVLRLLREAAAATDSSSSGYGSTQQQRQHLLPVPMPVRLDLWEDVREKLLLRTEWLKLQVECRNDGAPTDVTLHGADAVGPGGPNWTCRAPIASHVTRGHAHVFEMCLSVTAVPSPGRHAGQFFFRLASGEMTAVAWEVDVRRPLLAFLHQAMQVSLAPACASQVRLRVPVHNGGNTELRVRMLTPAHKEVLTVWGTGSVIVPPQVRPCWSVG